MTDLVRVAVCGDPEEAEVVAARLRADGVDAVVQLSVAAGGSGFPAGATVFQGSVASGGAGAHDVLVHAADATTARDLLTAAPVDDGELERQAMSFAPPDDL